MSVPHVFWADEVADQIIERDPSEPIVVKGGISPSGVPHLGNVNEILRGYVVAEVLRERGFEVRQVFTTDDRDPLRKLPRKLADLDGNIVDLGDVNAGALGKHLGHPYTDVPDPFGCCDSYGEHFSQLIADSAALLGVDVDVVSTTDLYENGSFEKHTRTVLENQETAREVLSHYQDKVDEAYVPFNPVCANCGKITETVIEVDLDGRTVDYRCADIEAGDRTIEGCGHEGVASFREGKLPWRFEWPAGWDVLGVDFEPFGKDHAEGSWPSGVDVAERVFGSQPPVPMAYEWFTLDGRAFSSSEGHVVLVHDLLSLLEPEVIRYFFTKDPGKARDFSVDRLDLLVDDFDRTERLYYAQEEGSDQEVALAERVYPLSIRPTIADVFADDFDGKSWADLVDDSGGRARVNELITDSDELITDINRQITDTGVEGSDTRSVEERNRSCAARFVDRVRIPFTFAAVLGMFDDSTLREEVARKQGHLSDDTPEWSVNVALSRVALASEWADRTDNEYNYELARAEIPDVAFDPETEAALDELADFVNAGHDGETIQGEIYETARRHDRDVGEFFGAGYRLLFDETDGPRLGPFIAKLDREFVVRRLRREA